MLTLKNQILTTTPNFSKALEQIESSYWMRYYLASTNISSFVSPIGGGLACAVPSCDILAMNRVQNIGLKESLSQENIEDIIHFYQQAGSKRFFIQLPPLATKNDTEQLLIDNGFRHHNNWAKLYRRVSIPAIKTNPDLSIRQIGKEEATVYGQLLLQSFAWEEVGLAQWLSMTVGQANYRHYLVSYQGKAIAAGALFVEGNFASMAFAGTLKAYRGLGAQTLLLKTRLSDAQNLGAKFITAETAEPKPDKPVKSFDNMIKMGFRLAYQRQNWLYEFDKI